MELLSSRMAADFLKMATRNIQTEEFWVIAMNSQCRVIKADMLFRGTVDSCPIHPRDVFRFALVSNASGIIVGHNHPSGDPIPSEIDIKQTLNLKRAGEIIQIPLLDHIILGEQKLFFSFADQSWKVGGVNRPRPLL